MRMVEKGRSKKVGELVGSIEALRSAIFAAAEERGLDAWLVDYGEITLRPISFGEIAAFYADVRFNPNYGLTFVLRSLVTCGNGSAPVETRKMAQQYVDVMHHLKIGAASVHARRSAIRHEVLAVVAEAAAKRIPLELLSIEPDWVMVGGGMPIDADRIALDVRLLMTHLEEGSLLPDAFTFAAMDREDIGQQMRDRIVPEQRLLRSFSGADRGQEARQALN